MDCTVNHLQELRIFEEEISENPLKVHYVHFNVVEMAQIPWKIVTHPRVHTHTLRQWRMELNSRK